MSSSSACTPANSIPSTTRRIFARRSCGTTSNIPWSTTPITKSGTATVAQLAQLTSDRSGRKCRSRARWRNRIRYAQRVFPKSIAVLPSKHHLLDERPVQFDLERDKAAATPLRFPGEDFSRRTRRSALHCRQQSQPRYRGIARWQDIGGDWHRSGARKVDGDFPTAQFDHPQG